MALFKKYEGCMNAIYYTFVFFLSGMLWPFPLLAQTFSEKDSSPSSYWKASNLENRLKDLSQHLEIQDSGTLQKIDATFEPLVNLFHHLLTDETDREKARKLITERMVQDFMKDSKAPSSSKEADPDVLFRLAAKIYRESKPELSDYESKRRIIKTFNTVSHLYKKLHLKSEPHLVWFDPIPPKPPVDPEYQSFFDIQKDYWEDKRYLALSNLPPDQLPEGAMLPLMHFFHVSCECLRRGDCDGTPVDELLARYGERLSPAVVEYLSHPEKYEPNRKQGAYSWVMFEMIGKWSRESAEPIFRAALASGWGDCVRSLEGKDWAPALVEKFSDSPYGPIYFTPSNR